MFDGPAGGPGGLVGRVRSAVGGGLPGGVVDSTTRKDAMLGRLALWGRAASIARWQVRSIDACRWVESDGGILLFEAGAFSFSLKDWTICGGKVCPFSQISRSFLIFSWTKTTM